jgi:hypothetical protein
MPLPVYHPEQVQPRRDRMIVFPHRDAREKNYRESVSGLRAFCSLVNWQVCVTHADCNSREEYYGALSRAAFAYSDVDQETYGIAMLEAVLHGCIPLVPARLAYKEMYPDIYQFQNAAFPKLTDWIGRYEKDQAELRKSLCIDTFRYQIIQVTDPIPACQAIIRRMLLWLAR